MAPRMEHGGVQGTLAGVVLVGSIVFLYKIAELIGKIQSWEVLWNPPTVSEMLMAVVFGLMAVAAGVGLDLPALLKGPLGLLKGPDSDK